MSVKTYLLTYLITYLLSYLLIYLFIYLFIYLLTCINRNNVRDDKSPFSCSELNWFPTYVAGT